MAQRWLEQKISQPGNNIVIQHSDNSRSGYWHLQKDGALVKVGDTVRQGQIIGLSGKTGYAALPHLHFIVWKNDSRGWQQVATRFQTSKGIKYLRPWKWYRNKETSFRVFLNQWKQQGNSANFLPLTFEKKLL
jgi:murein DD-endopeptidase MepM/ murein hydrolase activator NlpD